MRIGYITTCPKVPVGGVGVIFWHVHILRKIGIDAFVVPDKGKFDPWWMEPKPDVEFASLSDDMDVWVIPEVRIDLVKDLKGTKVAFVQNHGLLKKEELYSHVDFVISVSEPSAQMIREKINLPTLVVNPFIHPSSPFYVGRKQKHSVLVLARKKAIFFLDHIRARIRGFNLYIVSNLTQRELAERYAHAEYYLHLSFPEGWPAPVAEAMASGCCVVGFSGEGGLEFMRHMETAYVAKDGNPEECIRGLKVLARDDELRGRICQEAKRTISTYTMERTRRQLMDFVEKLGFERYSLLMEKIVKLESRQAEEIGDILLKMFSPKSVIDLGCGPGIYLLPFKRAGCRVLGVDACPSAGEFLDEYEFVLADLTKPFLPPFKADICICFEVGEHIEEGYSAVLVENCTACSNTVIWSAARPGQEGFWHVNCQWLDFWIRLFESEGFYYDRKLTEMMKKKMFGKPGIEERKWLIWNGAVFRRGI